MILWSLAATALAAPLETSSTLERLFLTLAVTNNQTQQQLQMRQLKGKNSLTPSSRILRGRRSWSGSEGKSLVQILGGVDGIPAMYDIRRPLETQGCTAMWMSSSTITLY